MSGKVRQRAAANTADSATLSTNEKILKECHSVYTDPDNGECKFYEFFHALFSAQFMIKIWVLTNLGNEIAILNIFYS